MVSVLHLENVKVFEKAPSECMHTEDNKMYDFKVYYLLKYFLYKGKFTSQCTAQ